MTYPYKLVFDHLARAAVSPGLPKNPDGTFQPMLVAVNAAMGRIDKVDVLPRIGELLSLPGGMAALDEVIERNLARAAESPEIAMTACMVTMLDVWMLDGDEATLAPIEGQDISKMAGAHRYLAITIHRPGRRVMGRMPIINGQVGSLEIPPGVQVH